MSSRCLLPNAEIQGQNIILPLYFNWKRKKAKYINKSKVGKRGIQWFQNGNGFSCGSAVLSLSLFFFNTTRPATDHNWPYAARLLNKFIFIASEESYVKFQQDGIWFKNGKQQSGYQLKANSVALCALA